MKNHPCMVLLLIGTPGLGKTTVSRKLVKEYNFIHFTQDDYPNINKFVDAIKTYKYNKDSIIIIDRCNEKKINRKDMMEIFPDVPYIFIDFINNNNKAKIRKVAQDRIKDRDPTGQSLVYDPKNNGYVAFMIINKKLKDYQPPHKSEGFYDLINIKLGWDINHIIDIIMENIS